MKPEDLVIFVSHNLETGKGVSGGPVYFGHNPDDLKNLVIIGVWNSGFHQGGEDKFVKAAERLKEEIETIRSKQQHPFKSLTIYRPSEG